MQKESCCSKNSRSYWERTVSISQISSIHFSNWSKGHALNLRMVQLNEHVILKFQQIINYPQIYWAKKSKRSGEVDLTQGLKGDSGGSCTKFEYKLLSWEGSFNWPRCEGTGWPIAPKSFLVIRSAWGSGIRSESDVSALASRSCSINSSQLKFYLLLKLITF